MSYATRLRWPLAGAIVVMALAGVMFAAVSTDKADYSPGSVVTITGDGYKVNEGVYINVVAPYGVVEATTQSDSTGLFRWSFRLPADSSAIGSYSYTASGLTSGVVQSGTFTDDGADSPQVCKGGPSVEVPDGDGDGSGLTVGSDTVSDVTATAPEGFTITAVCIKTGEVAFGTQKHSEIITVDGTYGNGIDADDNALGCYTVAGIGTETVSVTITPLAYRGRNPNNGNLLSCRDISHVDYVLTEDDDDEGDVHLSIEKTTNCPNVGIYATAATACTFTISYTNSPAPTVPVTILDTLNAEWKVTGLTPSCSPTACLGSATTSQTNLTSATDITWVLPAGTTSATLLVNIQTVPNPGLAKRGKALYKPTSCGDLFINKGATAYDLSDPFNPVVVVGPSNQLVVEAVGDSLLGATKPCEVPKTTQGLTATLGATLGTIDLDWADNGDAALTGYNVYTAGNVLVRALGTSPSSFSDRNLIAGTEYCYTVKAVNPVGESTDSKTVSQTVCATVPVPAPAP